MPSLTSAENNVGINITTSSDKSGIDDVNNNLGGMVGNFQDGMKKIAVFTGATAAGITAFAKSSTDYLQGLVKDSKALATQTGMTVEQSSQLLAVTDKLGISSGNASIAFRTLSKQIADASDTTSDNALKTEDLNNKMAATKIQINLLTAEQQKNGDSTGAIANKISGLNIQLKEYQSQISASSNTLQKLGINTVNADGTTKDFNTVLLSVADAFKAMPDGAEKTADALSLFGRAGSSMIKVLDQGSDGIKDMEAQATKLGLTLTSQNIGTIAKYTESQKKLAETTNSLKLAVGELTAPVMTSFNNTLNNMLLKLIGVDSPFRQVTADVLAFGGPILGATSAVAAFLGNVSSAIPLLQALRNSMIFGTVFDAFKVGAAEIRLITIPSIIASITEMELAWTAAFPIAGILLDIGLVYAAIQSVIGAFNAMDAAKASATNASNQRDMAIANMKNLIQNGTPTQQADAKRSLHTLGVAGYASGGYTGSGGANEFAGVVHKGEYVLPKSQVDQGTGMPKAMTGHTYNISVTNTTAAAVQEMFRNMNNDTLLTTKGMTVRQGM